MPEGGATYKTLAAAKKAAEEKAGQVIKVKGGFAVVEVDPAPIEDYFEKPPETQRNMGGTMRNMPGYMGGGMMPGYMDGGMMPGYMDGGMMDETLGYTRGGMKEEKRGPIKYSKGGAIKGKNYKGSF
tara:strand:+ start:52 stop:432 length:381 start_codon:yes stop_codon:yes gene_type:complete